MSETKNLPALSELHYDVEKAFKNDKLNLLLNQEPVKNWIKEHPMAKGVFYVPIDKVELMLTRIFQEWRVEVRLFQPLFNSVSVHIRLHYLNPITSEWSYQDGLGAVPVQTDKGASAADLGKIKNDAIMKALPAAESYAVKDAAEKLGKLFGKDLNRRDTLPFSGAYDAGVISDEQADELNEMANVEQIKRLLRVFRITGLDQIPAARFEEAKALLAGKK